MATYLSYQSNVDVVNFEELWIIDTDFLYVTIAIAPAAVDNLNSISVEQYTADHQLVREWSLGEMTFGTNTNTDYVSDGSHWLCGLSRNPQPGGHVLRLQIYTGEIDGYLRVKDTDFLSGISATIYDGTVSDESYDEPRGHAYHVDIPLSDDATEELTDRLRDPGVQYLRPEIDLPEGWMRVENRGTGKGSLDVKVDGNVVHTQDVDALATVVAGDESGIIIPSAALTPFTISEDGVFRDTGIRLLDFELALVGGGNFDDNNERETVSRSTPVKQARGVSEIVLVLDRSGSMDAVDEGSELSRWDLAVGAASSLLQAALADSASRPFVVTFSVSTATAIGGDDGEIKWFTPLTAAPTDWGSPNGRTPTGEGMKRAAALFQPGELSRDVNARYMIIMTDGKHNQHSSPSVAYNALELANKKINVIPLIWGTGAYADAWEGITTYQVPGGALDMEQHYIVDEINELLGPDEENG